MKTSMGLGTCLALLSAMTAAPATAQTAVSVSAGAASYDLSGVGTSGTFAGRYDIGLAPQLELQLGMGYFWYRSQGDRSIGMLLPEAGLFTRPLPVVPLYLGAGVGYALGVRGDPPNEPTLFGALGLELPVAPTLAIRPELRVRTVDPWVGTIADFAVGLRVNLGR